MTVKPTRLHGKSVVGGKYRTLQRLLHKINDTVTVMYSVNNGAHKWMSKAI